MGVVRYGQNKGPGMQAPRRISLRPGGIMLFQVERVALANLIEMHFKVVLTERFDLLQRTEFYTNVSFKIAFN